MVGSRRLVALASALGLAAAGSLLAISPVQADTGDITYTCAIPEYDLSQDITISLRTDAPDTMAVGESFAPTLKLTVVIPAFIILLAGPAGYTHASAQGTLGVGINGTETPLSASYAKTKLPNGFQDFPVTIDIPLPEVAPTSAGTFRYTPGPLNAKLAVYKGELDESPDSIDANCVVKAPSPGLVIDTITVTDGTTPPAKVATTTAVSAPSAPYGRSGKVSVTVANAGGQPIEGTVALAGVQVAPQTVANGKAVFTLPRGLAVKTYALKATYSGSSTLAGSTKEAAFTVVKGTVGGLSLSLTKKPTSKKSGKAKVVVKAPTGLATPTGKVTLLLKKGSKTKSVTVSLSGGKKTVVLPKLKKGTWTVTVKYAGSGTYKSVTSKSFAFKVTK